MFNSTELLMEDVKTTMEKVESKRVSFALLAGLVMRRQKIGKDSIVVISGTRRNGKSNWSLGLIKEYIAKRKAESPDFTWSWEDNFAKTRSEAMEKIMKLPARSFIVYDEGGDTMLSSDAVTRWQIELVKFLLKCGIKELLVIIVIPDIHLLSKRILNMAILLILVPYRYEYICSFAFIYGRNPNDWVTDKFNIERVKMIFRSRKTPKSAHIPALDGRIYIIRGGKKTEVPYPKGMFKFYMSIPNFLHIHRFMAVNKRFENQYLKHVKSKLLERGETEEFVNISDFRRLQHRYGMLLYNLNTRQGLNIAQIERLHQDNMTGKLLSRRETIKLAINFIAGKKSIELPEEEPEAEVEENGEQGTDGILEEEGI